MSRVGKYPVQVPSGVQLALSGRTLVAKGKLGELKLDLTDDVLRRLGVLGLRNGR